MHNLYSILLDVDECTKTGVHVTRMLHNCSENEKCINEHGSFNCECNPGFSEVGGICDSKFQYISFNI